MRPSSRMSSAKQVTVNAFEVSPSERLVQFLEGQGSRQVGRAADS